MDPRSDQKIVPLPRSGGGGDAYGAPPHTSYDAGEELGQENSSDQFWDFLGVLRRRWRIAAPIAVVVFAVSFGSAAMAPKRYNATAALLLNPTSERVITGQELVSEQNAITSSIDSEIEVMRSVDVMLRVVELLGLDKPSPSQPPVQKPASASLPAMLSPIAPLVDAMFPVPAAPPAPTDDSMTADERQALQRMIAERLPGVYGLRQREGTGVVEITASSGDPQQASDLANALAQAYLAELADLRATAMERAQGFLRQRASELADEVRKKDAAAESFRMANGLAAMSVGAENGDIQSMLASARAELTEKQARLQQVEVLVARGGSPDQIAGAANSGVLQTLRSEQITLQRKQAELEDRYGPRHPDVLRGRQELQSLQEKIQAEIERVTAGLRNDLEVARRRLASLQQNFGSETMTLNSQNSGAVIQYRQLLSEAEAARSVHQSFVQRVEEVESQSALPTSQARMLTVARAPSVPSSPNVRGALQTSLIFAAVAGIGLAFLIELLDRSVGTAKDVQRKIGRPTVASALRLDRGRFRTLPPAARHPAGYIVEKPMSDFAEAFRVMRTSLLRARIDKRVQVVAVTSALAGEGKTTVSLCLARIAAMSGQRVALIDCDLRYQSVADRLGLSGGMNLVEVLSGDDWGADVFQPDDETTLQIISGSPDRFTPRDVFSSRAMQDFINGLRDEFDLIIFDCAPVLHVADTRVAAALADLTIVVVRAEKTPAVAVKNAVRDLERAGADVHGIALNCASPAAARMDYSGGLSYSKNGYYAY